jgi:aminoglycoside phosphotransferase (APT) family kinase protein
MIPYQRVAEELGGGLGDGIRAVTGMRDDRPLTTQEVEALAGRVLGRAVDVRLLEAKDRNQVFAVGEEAILKVYLADGLGKRARKVAALRFLEGRGLPVPRLLGHGVLHGVPWTLETRVVGEHRRPTRAEINSPDGVQLHRALGRWLPQLHALGGLVCFGSWEAEGPTRLSAYVLPRARAVRDRSAGLEAVPRPLLRRAGRELERLEPAIRAADRLPPRLVHGDYGTSNAAVGQDAAGRWRVVGVFDFESALPGDPVEDFLWTADHGLDSPVFAAFVAGYLERGRLDADAPERLAFYQLEHCLEVLDWAWRSDRPWFVQAQRLVQQLLDGARMRPPG